MSNCMFDICLEPKCFCTIGMGSGGPASLKMGHRHGLISFKMVGYTSLNSKGL